MKIFALILLLATSTSSFAAPPVLTDDAKFRQEFRLIMLGNTKLVESGAKKKANTPLMFEDKQYKATVSYLVASDGMVRVEMLFPKVKFNLNMFRKIEDEYKWPDGEFFEVEEDGSSGYYQYIEKEAQQNAENRVKLIKDSLLKAYMIGCALSPDENSKKAE